MVSQEQEPKETRVENSHNNDIDSLFSPRFKSIAAMAGWDEESIITASLIVEDTPDRQFKHKKRSDLHFKTPPSNSSRRKRRAQRKSPIAISVPVITLDEEEEEEEEEEKEKEAQKQETQKVKKEPKVIATEEDKLTKENSSDVSCSNSGLPCMDKLREELSCAICLEICFEPSTTSCGHSFCKKCLRSAADKCGKKCPKCRQIISNGRSCTVNTVLWNTIQLLFPREVEARKAAGALNSQEAERKTPPTRTSTDTRNRAAPPYMVSASSRDVTARRRGAVSQDGDSLLGLRSHRDDVSRLLSSYASGMSRRVVPSQDGGAEFGRSLQRENLSRLLSRDAGARRRRGTPSQDEDAALALRLQREEFMEAFRGTNDQSGMAARAVSLRMRSLRNRAT